VTQPVASGGPEWSADRLGDPDGGVLAVFIHGGFWRARYDASAIAALASGCADDAELGAWVWNIEYPRVGMAGGGWPGTGVAVADAVGAAVTAAAGRPVVLIGHSAGGHLALWAAREHPVTAVVSLAGVTDLAAADRAGLGRGAVRELFGSEGPPPPEVLAAASPIERLPLRVSALLIHGDADRNVPVQQSRAYAAAARAAGDACELHELPGAEHFEVVDPGGRAWPILRERLVEVAEPG
jgi:acetyl esterase/lipase